MKRQSNIELLRIICMLLIIGGHFSAHSGFEFSRDVVTVQQLWTQFLGIGGLLGVNLFVLITGYFMITQNKVSISKAVRLWLQIEFYSIGIYLIAVIFGYESLGIKQIIWNSFPLIFEKWWFASTYFVLYLLSPYLNKLLNTITKADYHRLLLLLLVFWCVIPTITNKAFQGNNLLWFITLYSLAAYFRLYGLFIEKYRKYWKIAAVGCYAMVFLSIVLLDFLRMCFSGLDVEANYFAKMQSITLLALAVSIFLMFLSMEMGVNIRINKIATTVFGIYLIHDHPTVRQFIWKGNVGLLEKNNTITFIAMSLIVILVVFIISSLVEFIRLNFIEKLYAKKLNDVFR